MDTLSTFFKPIVGFLITVVFGFWLSKVGKPYNGVLFNVHKLIALGTVIVASVQVYKMVKVLEPRSLLTISIVLAVLGVVALFASGAFLSIGNLNYQTMKTIHNIALILEGLALIAILYLFNGKT